MGTRPPAENHVALLQLHGDLRHAQSQLQSAQRAAEHLRTRFTVEEIGRHAEPAVLSTAQASAAGLHEFFSSIPRPPLASDEKLHGPQWNETLKEAQVLEAIADVAAYMRSQRERFLPISAGLQPGHVDALGEFFSPTLLRRVRVVELARQGLGRLEVRPSGNGYQSLLDFTHMASVTFEDVVVFNETLTMRSLFHALVHVVQFQLLGLERYTELFVRAFLTTRWRFNVPLEAHAFELESKFAADRAKGFLVEDEVRAWINQERY
jgi:hypothetical protein